MPLVSRGRVVGVIDSEHPDPGAFGDAELEVLTTVAAMVSAKIELLAEAERSTQRYQDLVKSHAQLSEETSNRKALEAKLFEARKLEAIGRLTGWFAHDFNNLLTVISGNLELLEGDITQPLSIASLNDARAAAGRGAKLIRDMLAFSQRTRLEPQICDLNTLVTTTCERSKDILTQPVELCLAQDPWMVHVDPKVAETALVNLILNAQEAMPDGGRLEIATENVRHGMSGNQALATRLAPGRYLCLSVRDEGEGIREDRLQQIFDPFFTSKPVGTGTGLGLSMVFGFMQQSGGAVDVQSKVAHGSVFRLYFPAVTSDGNVLLTKNP